MPVLRPAGGHHQLVDSHKVGGYEVGRTGTGSPLANPASRFLHVVFGS